MTEKYKLEFTRKWKWLSLSFYWNAFLWFVFNSLVRRGRQDLDKFNFLSSRYRKYRKRIRRATYCGTSGREVGSMDPWIQGVTMLGWACIPPEYRKPGVPRDDEGERERESEIVGDRASLPEHRNRKGAEPTRARADFIRWWDRSGSLTLPMLLLDDCARQNALAT